MLSLSCRRFQGGFARVYQVRRLGTHEVLAAKVICKSKMLKPKDRARVAKEIAIHKSVSGHRNILSFQGSFNSDEDICILSEICLKSVSFLPCLFLNFNFNNI